MNNELFEKSVIKRNQAKNIIGGCDDRYGTIGERETLIQTIWPWLTKDHQAYTDGCPEK